jgi:hypothetical protein
MHDVAVDADGNVVITGDIIDAVDFGNGRLFGDGGSQDPFLAKFDASGTAMWSTRFTSTQAPYNRASAVATGPGNDVVAVGIFLGDITPGETTHTNAANGGNPLSRSHDGYIARFGP